MGLNDSPFLDACWGRNSSGHIPIWIMRQAGRYLPEYRAIREKASFLELCKSPDLIAEVVRQPIARFNLDAAILFSDILTLLEPMGVPVEFPDGGPRLGWTIQSPDDVDRLKEFDVTKDLSFVFQGIRQIRSTLPDTPVIGFAGSPFTLACYLIQGRGHSNFDKAKQFLHKYPEAAEKLLMKLARVTGKYLEAQIDAGAHVVQVFDSWGGILAPDDYLDWSARSINEIFRYLKPKGVPRILFVNNVAPYLDIVRDIDCDVVGVDYRIDLAHAAAALGGKAVQGNLDPTVLFGPIPKVIERTTQILDSLERHDNLIFNLGHGILPETPIDAVHAVVETVHGYKV